MGKKIYILIFGILFLIGLIFFIIALSPSEEEISGRKIITKSIKTPTSLQITPTSYSQATDIYQKIGKNATDLINIYLFEIEEINKKLVEETATEYIYDITLKFTRTEFGNYVNNNDEEILLINLEKDYKKKELMTIEDVNKLKQDLIKPRIEVLRGNLLNSKDIINFDLNFKTISEQVFRVSYNKNTVGAIKVRIKFGYDSVNWDFVASINHGTSAIISLAFSNNSDYLAYGEANSGDIGLLDINTWNNIRNLTDGTGNVYDLYFTLNDTYILNGNGDGTVYVYWVSNGSLAYTINATGGIYAMAVSPDGLYVSYGGADNYAETRLISDWSVVANTSTFVGDITSIVYSNQNDYLAVGDIVGNITLFHVGNFSGVQGGSFDRGGVVDCLCFDKSGIYLFYGGNDPPVLERLWVRNWSGADGIVASTRAYDCDVRNDDYIYGSGADNKDMQIYYMDNISSVINITMTGKVHSLKFSKEGDWLAGGDENGNIYVYDISAPPPFVTLHSPINASSILSPVTFNCSAYNNINLVNISSWINYTEWHRNQTNATVFNNSYTTFSVDLPDGTYLWNCEACNNENCSFASLNYSFDILNHTYSAFTDKSIITEGSNVLFSLYVNRTNIESTNASLYINNTYYPADTITATSNYYYFELSKTIPQGWGNTTGAFFNWSWNYSIQGIINNETTIEQELRVYSVSIDDCSSNDIPILNFTINDEETDLIMSLAGNRSLTVKIDLSLISETYIWNYNNTFINQTTFGLCLPENVLNTTNYTLNLVGDYVAYDYAEEFYYMDNENITNATSPLLIYFRDLLLDDSTTFLFTFEDINGLPIEDGIVIVSRYYVGNGTFKEVERGKMDDNGQTHLHLVEEDVIYKFNITYNGILVFESRQYNAKCISTPCEISLSATEDIEEFPDDWDRVPDGSYKIKSNRTSRVVSLRFILDESAEMNLSVYKFSQNQTEMDTMVIGNTLIASSGSIEVTVPIIYGNATYYASAFKDDEWISSRWVNLAEDTSTYFGTIGLLMAGIMILALGLMACTNGSALIFMTLLGLLIAGALKLLNLDWYIFVMFACAGIIIIYKIRKRS